jgi:hypothetical protein
MDKPIFTLIWQDVARVMVETEGFEMAADFPTDVLVNMLNTIEDGLEYLDWYDNIQHSLRKGRPDPAATESGNHRRQKQADAISSWVRELWNGWRCIGNSRTCRGKREVFVGRKMILSSRTRSESRCQAGICMMITNNC